MSKVVDKRVVEMSFDNSRFEENVAESMSTLDKLKAKLSGLKDTSTNLDKVGKAANDIDLSKLDKSLDSINKRFSTMGIIGATAIEDITKSAMGLVKTFGSNLWSRTIGQITSGGKNRAHNIEQSKFLLEGMGITFSKDVDDQISEAVSDTAFGYDEAAMAMAQLSGAGVQLGDDMEQALKAISGVAAMTNRTFSDIADIFVDSAAAGKVAGDAFNRLGERGLAAKQIMMDFYGINADQLNKLAKAGQISFNDFSKAMYEAFGAQAKKSNDTLDGVLSNINAALSRIGAIFYQPLMENNSDIVKMLNSLKKIISDFKSTLIPTADLVTKYILSAARALKRFFDQVKILDENKNLTKLGKTLESFFTNAATIIINIAETLDNLRTNIIAPFFRQITKAFYDVFPELDKGQSLFITLTESFVKFTEKLRDGSKHLGILGEKGEGVRVVFRFIFNILKLILNILNTLLPIIQKIGDVTIVVITAISNALSKLMTIISPFLEKIKMIGTNIVAGIYTGMTEGLPKLFAVIGAIFSAIIGKFCSLFKIESPSQVMMYLVGLNIALGIAAGIIFGKERVENAVELVYGFIIKAFEKLGNTALGKVISSFSNLLSSAMNMLSESIDRLAASIKSMEWDKYLDLITKLERFAVLAGLIILIFQFIRVAGLFTSTLRSVAETVKIYIRSNFGLLSKIPSFLQNLALAISVISYWVVFFSYLPFENVKQGLFIVGGILAALTTVILITGVLVKAIEGFDKVLLTRMGFAFASIAGSVMFMAIAAKKLEHVPWQTLVVTFLGIVGVLSAIMFAMYKFKQLSWTIPNQKNREWATIIAFAVSISFVVNSIIKACLAIAIADAVGAKDAMFMAVKLIGSIMLALTVCVGILLGVSKLKKEMDAANPAPAILAMAISVRLIVNAIMILTSAMCLNEDLVQEAVVQVGIIMAIIGIIIGTIQAVNNAGKVEGVGSSLISLALAIASFGIVIYAFGNAIEQISNVEEDDFNRAIKAMYNLMAFIALETVLVHFVGMEASIMFASMGVFIAACGYVVSTISEMQAGMEKGFIALGAIIFAMIAVTGILGKIKPMKETNQVYKMLIGLGVIIAASALIINTCADLNPFQIAKGLVVIGAIMASVAGISILLRGTFKTAFPSEKELKDDKKKLNELLKIIRKLASTIIKIAGSIAIIGAIMKKIAGNDSLGAVISGSIAMGVAMAGLALLVYVLTSFDDTRTKNIEKMAKPIKAIAYAAMSIAASIALLSIFPAERVMVGGFIMALILGLITGIINACKSAETEKVNIKSLVTTILGIVAIATALTVMVTLLDGQKDSWALLLSASGAMVIALLGIIGAMALMSKIKDDEIKWSTIFKMLLSCISFLIIGASFKIALAGIGNFDWWAYISVAGGMALALAAVIGAGFVMGKLAKSDAPGMVIGALILAGLCGELIIIANALSKLAVFDWNSIWGALKGMGIALTGILVVAGILGAVAYFTEGIGLAVIALGLLTIAGAILELSWTASALKKFSEAFEQFGDALAKVADSISEIVTSISEGISSLAKTINEEGKDAVDAAVEVMNSVASESAKALGVESPSTVFSDIGKWCMLGLVDGMEVWSNKPNGPIETAKKVFEFLIKVVKRTLGINSPSIKFFDIAKWCIQGFVQGQWEWGDLLSIAGEAAGLNYVDSFKDGLGELIDGTVQEQVANSMDGVFSGVPGGGFSNVLDAFDYSKFLSADGIDQFKDFIGQSNMTTGSMSSDSIAELIQHLKDAGFEGTKLNDILVAMGFSLEDLKANGVNLSSVLGTEEAKDGLQGVSSEVQNVVDSIIRGEFGNAPKRWDELYTYFIKQGKTAQEAYAAIAEAQNAVNQKLGSNVKHTAEEIEKKVSASVKKANEAAEKLNEQKKTESDTKDNKKFDKKEELQEKKIAAEKKIHANEEMLALNVISNEKRKQLELENENLKKQTEVYQGQLNMLEAANGVTYALDKQSEAADKVAKKYEKQVVYQQELAKEATHLTKSPVITHGTQEYEDLKHSVSINNKPTERDERFKDTSKEYKKTNESMNFADLSREEQIKRLDAVESNITELKKHRNLDLGNNYKRTTEQIIQELTKTENDVKNTSSNITSSTKNTKEFIAAESKKAGETMAKEFVNGANSNSIPDSKFKGPANKALSQINSKQVHNDSFASGENITKGVASGMTSYMALQSVSKAGTKVASTANNSIIDYMKISSPSKVTFDEGVYIVKGLVNGILSSLGMVRAASTQIGEASLQAVVPVVAGIQNSISAGLDLTPVITPVINASNIQNDLTQIDSMLNQRHIASITENFKATQDFKTEQYQGLENRIGDMQEAISMLGSAIINQPTPEVNANVILQGDAAGLFRSVQQSNNQYQKMHGRSAFA